VLLPVDEIYCHSAIAKKTNKPYLVIKVRSGLVCYSKNLMLGWEGYAQHKAVKELEKLINMTSDTYPIDVHAAMRLFEAGDITFKPFTHIEVDFNTPYKDITKFIGEKPC
jgi:hypothetical protein